MYVFLSLSRLGWLMVGMMLMLMIFGWVGTANSNPLNNLFPRHRIPQPNPHRYLPPRITPLLLLLPHFYSILKTDLGIIGIRFAVDGNL